MIRRCTYLLPLLLVMGALQTLPGQAAATGACLAPATGPDQFRFTIKFIDPNDPSQPHSVTNDFSQTSWKIEPAASSGSCAQSNTPVDWPEISIAASNVSTKPDTVSCDSLQLSGDGLITLKFPSEVKDFSGQIRISGSFRAAVMTIFPVPGDNLENFHGVSGLAGRTSDYNACSSTGTDTLEVSGGLAFGWYF